MVGKIFATFWLIVGSVVCIGAVVLPSVPVWTRVGVVAFVAVVILWPVAGALFGIYYPPADCPLGLPDRYC